MIKEEAPGFDFGGFFVFNTLKPGFAWSCSLVLVLNLFHHFLLFFTIGTHHLAYITLFQGNWENNAISGLLSRS